MSPLEEGKVKTTDTAEAVGGKPGDAEAAPPVIDAGLGEGTVEPKTPEVDWAKHGLDNFQGKSMEEIAEHLKFRDRQYGTQSNELGELRKKVEEFDALKAQISGKEAPVKEIAAQMSDVELSLFAEAFNQNPYAAIEKFILPKMEESLTGRVFDKVKEQFGPVLDKKSEDLANKQEFAAFAREHSDYQEYADVMKQLMAEQYIGNVDYDEAYKLAVLSKKEPSLFGETCKWMRYGISFDEAREHASLKQSAGSTAEAKVNEVKEEVASVATGGKRTATKQVTSEPDIKTMEDVVDSMVKE